MPRAKTTEKDTNTSEKDEVVVAQVASVDKEPQAKAQVAEVDKEPQAKATVVTSEIPEPKAPVLPPSKEDIEQGVKELSTEELKAQLASANAKLAMVQETNKPNLVRVRFIKAHTFNKGTEIKKMLKGDIEMVEPHLANKFVSRNIAYILM